MGGPKGGAVRYGTVGIMKSAGAYRTGRTVSAQVSLSGTFNSRKSSNTERLFVTEVLLPYFFHLLRIE